MTKLYSCIAAATLALAPAYASHSAAKSADTTTGEAALAAAVAGEWRSAESRARDAQRHPIESLSFWGLEPGMTILEVQPGAQSWWTEILAPYAHATGGSFYATGPDLSNSELSAGARKARAEFEAHYGAKPAIYGKVEVVNWGAKSAPLPADRFDFILTSRSVHGWMRTPGEVENTFKQFFVALKPGGILALEQHRANPGSTDTTGENGYVLESYVIEQAQKAGFKLAARSEINANPRDTKDHPFGVWTLPPALRSTAYGSGKDEDPSFDHSRYVAIGESDRMTLKFVKP